MRLLNAVTGQMKEFVSDDKIPPYAILSHRWGPEELGLRDWQSLAEAEWERMAGYGEGGKKAFLRLQQEIMNLYPLDHTLFAWGTLVDKSSIEIVGHAAMVGLEPLPWRPPGRDDTPLGLLAETPRDFEHSGSFVSEIAWAGEFYLRNASAPKPAAMFGQGIRLDVPDFSSPSPVTTWYWDELKMVRLQSLTYVSLICYRRGSQGSGIFIPMLRLYEGRWARTRKLVEVSWSRDWGDVHASQVTIYCQPITTPQILHGDFILGRGSGPRTIVYESQSYDGKVSYNPDLSLYHRRRPFQGEWVILFFKETTGPDGQFERGLALSLWRDEREAGQPVHVGLTPIHFSETQGQCRSMAAPLDAWECRLGPLPPVWVQVERLPLGGDGGFVDAIDFSIARDELTPENICIL